MNLPSFENLTTRLLPFALWPSAMKMSPFGAVTTSLGALKCDESLPATPASPSVISSLPCGENLKT